MNTKLKKHIKSLKVIYFITLLSPLLLLIVFTRTLQNQTLIIDPKMDGVLKYLVPVFGIVFITAGFLIYNRGIRKIQAPDPALKLQKHRSLFMIRIACIEGTAMLAIVSFLITMNELHIVYALSFMLAYIPVYPGKAHIERELNL